MNTVAATVEVKTTLTWKDLRNLGKFDGANRFDATHPAAIEYINMGGYRTPSRAWPHSHSKPLMTAKFAKWLKANHADVARQLGLH
jgi:hypothetical protein